MIFLSHLFSPSPRSWRGEGGVRGYFSIGTRGESPSPGSHLRCDPTSPRKRGEVKKLHRHRVNLVLPAHQLDVGAHRGRGAGLVAAHDRDHDPVVLGVRIREPSVTKELGEAVRMY